MNNALNALVVLTLVGLAYATAAVSPTLPTVPPSAVTPTYTSTPISFTQPPESRAGKPSTRGAIDFYRRTFETMPSERQNEWEEFMQAQVWRNPQARVALETILIDILEVTDEFTSTPGRPPIHELLISAKHHRSDVYALLLAEFGFARLPESLNQFYPRPRGFEGKPVPFLEEGDMVPPSLPGPAVIFSNAIQPI